MNNMRLSRSVTLVLILFLLVPQSSVNAAPNAPVNGDFEQGWGVGWTEHSLLGWAVVWDTITFGVPITSHGTPLAAHSGSWIAWLGGDDSENAYIQQSVTVSPNTNLSFWYWIDSKSSCGNDFGYFRINSVDIETWNLCTSTDTGGWVQSTMNLNSYSGQTITLEFRLTTGAISRSSLFVDDVNFYRRFADVPIGYWAENYIEALATAGITGGCGSGNYCPAAPVTRAQMAVFLLRGIHGSSYVPPPATGAVFNDVPANYWAAAWIEQLAAEGITGGCGGGNYCPEYSITRDQMAVFLLRARYGSGHVPPPASGAVFGDVPASYWAAGWIEQLAAEGITGGCGNGNYCPTGPVTRDQMAVFLQRVFNLPLP
jgi:hypothetical protein